jgi:hypothetical protein
VERLADYTPANRQVDPTPYPSDYTAQLNALAPRMSAAESGLLLRATKTDQSYGRVPSNVGQSCLDIKTKVPWATDGPYLVDPDGAGSLPTMRVLCDMTRDGGGWTLLLKNRYQSGIFATAASFGTIDDLTGRSTSIYKLADVVVNPLVGDGQFDIMADQTGWNTYYSTANLEYVLGSMASLGAVVAFLLTTNVLLSVIFRYVILRDYTAQWTYTAQVAASSTLTTMESYRSSDNLMIWRGRLDCADGGSGTVGISCMTLSATSPSNPVGQTNPQGGAGCLVAMGTASNTAWHHFVMAYFNTESDHRHLNTPWITG